MTALPAHIQATTETTTKFRCAACGSRLIISEPHAHPDALDQLLGEWLARHAHDQGPTS